MLISLLRNVSLHTILFDKVNSGLIERHRVVTERASYSLPQRVQNLRSTDARKCMMDISMTMNDNQQTKTIRKDSIIEM
jgi:hypothetical protein